METKSTIQITDGPHFSASGSHQSWSMWLTLAVPRLQLLLATLQEFAATVEILHSSSSTDAVSAAVLLECPPLLAAAVALGLRGLALCLERQC